ncbi:MAG: hypothetical protein H8E32_04185 [Nitrospinae bacterium]|nr:hypothetical protein [Nitrospinota bacterium]
MNIFILDKDIQKCAQYHCDRHVVKMILESAQMLSTGVRLSGLDEGYKMTHPNHPCSLWVMESLANWKWLRELSKALNEEYRFRFDRKVNHKSYDLICSLSLPKISDLGLTPFTQAMPDEYRHKNPVKAYRKYYKGEKSSLFKWTKRPKPPWIKQF